MPVAACWFGAERSRLFMHIFRRSPVRIGTVNENEPGLQEAISALDEECVSAAEKNVFSEFRDWRAYVVEEDRRRLEHALSDVWLSRCGEHTRSTREPQQELIVQDLYRHRLRACLVSSRSFNETTSSMVSELLGRKVQLRRSGAGLEADAGGVIIRFCPPAEVPALVDELHSTINASSLNPAMKAVFMLVSLLNIHPFEDGNGRCARIWFNTMLEIGYGGRFLLPLRVFAEMSCGGFEMRMRDAEINGRWQPLVDYLAVVLEISNSAMRTRESVDTNHEHGQ
jgi:Fic/DOC family